MDYRITTTYCREDIDGFYDAFLSGKKSIRLSKKITKVVTTALAALIWGFAALMLLATLPAKSIQITVGALPLTMAFALLGAWLFSLGRRGFRSKAAWKAYPFRGEPLIFQFSHQEFVLYQRNTETKTRYGGIVRLYEDDLRFYLFTSPQNAHILPKRDLGAEIAAFRQDIMSATGLPMEGGPG